jgi:hypothetical protein
MKCLTNAQTPCQRSGTLSVMLCYAMLCYVLCYLIWCGEILRDKMFRVAMLCETMKYFKLVWDVI